MTEINYKYGRIFLGIGLQRNGYALSIIGHNIDKDYYILDTYKKSPYPSLKMLEDDLKTFIQELDKAIYDEMPNEQLSIDCTIIHDSEFLTIKQLIEDIPHKLSSPIHQIAWNVEAPKCQLREALMLLPSIINERRLKVTTDINLESIIKQVTQFSIKTEEVSPQLASLIFSISEAEHRFIKDNKTINSMDFSSELMLIFENIGNRIRGF